MRKITFIVLAVILLLGCGEKDEAPKSQENPFVERYMKKVTQLTFEGDNGEAYFSPDDRQLIYQSNRGGIKSGS
jgi:uncharacterized protein YcfL